MTEPVSEKLKKPRRPLITALIAVGVVVVAGGAIVGGSALHTALTPVPAPTVAFVEAAQTGSVNAAPAVSDDQQTVADAQEAALEQAKADAEAAAQAAADQAARDAAAKKISTPNASYAPGQAPSGTPIPLHLDDDPNSGSYGQMVIENPDQFCASDGGTTGPNDVQVCL